MAVVFGPDAYTVGANINLDAYPSGAPDYTMAYGASANMVVNAANDRVQIPDTADWRVGRCSDAAAPTGNQEVTMDGNNTAFDEACCPALRCATSGTLTNFYLCYLNVPNANEVELYRFDDGGATLVASRDNALTGAGTRAFRGRATGTNPVELEFQVGATTTLTFSDSGATRKQTGTPGLGGYNGSANLVWGDNFQIDDLVVAGGSILLQMMNYH